MPIEQVRKAYEETIGEMKEKFPGGDTNTTDALIRGATDGLQKFSLDIAWQQRLAANRARFETDMSLANSRRSLVAAADGIDNKKLGDALNAWLIAADPFAGVQDTDALAKRGGKLLDVIKECFDLAVQAGQPAEAILADLVVMADRVRERLLGFETGSRKDLVDDKGKAIDAGSVTRQMYAELMTAIDTSNAVALISVREASSTNLRARDIHMRSIWAEQLTNKISDLQKNKKAPALLWSLASEEILEKLNSGTAPTKADLNKLLASRNLESQVNRLDKAVQGKPGSIDYVMKVREAAWAVQQTLGEYRRGIDSLWAKSNDDNRRSLDVNLFALDDWLKKQVNFVISTEFARRG